MAKEPRLERGFRQIPALSQQARMTVYILQLPLLELKGYLEQETLENPMLENVREQGEGDSRVEVESLEGGETGYPELQHPGSYDSEDEEKRAYLETLIAKAETLEDHLLWQLGMFLEGQEYEIGEYIVCDLDKNGYLKVSVEEVAGKFDAERSRIEEILSLVQTFDPAGVAARDLRECLLIQLRLQGREDSVAYRIAESHLDDVKTKNYQSIARKLKIDIKEVEKAVSCIERLEPKPGRMYSPEKAAWVIPDIILTREGDEFSIEMNNRYLPVLRTSKFYSNLLKDKKTDNNTKDYLKIKRERAKWIINAIMQRQDTIRRIAEFLVDFQKDYFENPQEGMKPLKLEDVAEKLSISESTVSRVVSKKHMQTEFGILPLKNFFSTALKQDTGESVSADHIKNKIKEIIAGEDSQKALSDQKIADTLKRDGLRVARRTVTKYRESMKILPAHLRKK
ncbi:MAG: RNA polymerase factor sigma-54 [Candidatus Omnitrophota bacterium]